jgi:alpha-beta hydrolase superfamily lysophospholipase
VGRPGRAALLWRAPAPAPAVVVVHGAGSRKENHRDFAEACAAAGMSALALDLRGHGESAGAPDAGMLDDVLAALERLRAEGAAPLGLRGSSLGGFLALHAAARDPGVRAVAALCPAPAEGLARVLGADWPLALPLDRAVARADGVARGYWHARGDERVPWTHSMRLAALTPQPRRLRIAMGGHHRSLQHDPAVIAETVAFLAGHLGAHAGNARPPDGMGSAAPPGLPSRHGG